MPLSKFTKNVPARMGRDNVEEGELLTESLFQETPSSAKPSRAGLVIDISTATVETSEVLEINPSPKDSATSPAQRAERTTSTGSSKEQTAEGPPQRASQNRHTSSNATYVRVELPGAAARYWRVASEGLEALNSIPSKATVVSISGADLRLPTQGALSKSRAQALAAEAAFEPVYVINASKKSRLLYASSQLRLDATDERIIPGIELIDELLELRGFDAHSSPIFGWRLQDSSKTDAVVVLYHRSPSGYVHGPDIYIYPKDLSSILEQFKVAQQVREPAGTVLFGPKDLLAVDAPTLAYPRKGSLGISLRHILWLCLLMAAIAFSVLGMKGLQSAKETLQLQHTRDAAAERRLIARPSIRETSPL